MDPTFDPSQLPLRDIHLPDAVPFWPPAPGWWLLAAVVVGVLVVLGVRRWLHRQQRAALRAIAAIRSELESGAVPGEGVQRLSSVLRRFAMTTAHDGNERGASAAAATGRASAHGSRSAEGGPRVGRSDVAGLVCTAWLRYLDSRWDRDEFAAGAGRLLTAAPYVRPEQVDRLHAIELTQLCGEWVRAQRRAHTARAPHAVRAHAVRQRPSRVFERLPFLRGARAR
jgi:hypothetical protein